MAKSMKLGGGGRFEKGEKELEGKGYSEGSARRIMAARGMKKYGKRKMGRMARAGKRRRARRR